jgi:plastocyanin
VYNPNGVSVTATISLFDGSVLLGTTSVVLGPHAVTQVNNIYGVLGFGSLVKTDGYATVVSSNAQSPLFTYAAEADNASGDLILVVGSTDLPAPAGFSPPTPTPVGGAPAPTPTPTPPASAVFVVNIGASGNSFTDVTSGTNMTTVHVGDTVKWVWMSGTHSSTSGSCMGGGGGYYAAAGCTPDNNWDSDIHSPSYSFSWTFKTAGTYKYFCSVHLDSMVGAVMVQP